MSRQITQNTLRKDAYTLNTQKRLGNPRELKKVNFGEKYADYMIRKNLGELFRKRWNL